MKKSNRKISGISNLVVLGLFVLLASCSISEKTTPEIRNFFVMDDNEPPVLLEVQSVSNNQVRLVFNEEITPYQDSFSPNRVEVEGYSLLITLTQNVKAGHQVLLYGRVKDRGGNTTGIETPVWGFNTELPEIVINEFSTRGDDSNPDRTELLIKSSGNIAGAVLYNGVPDSWDSRVVFDDTDVEAGDFIVVWWTDRLPDGVGNSAHVLNVCAQTADNLPGYNGVLTLAESPAQGADVTDCVVYSNNSLTYEGYGTKTTMERAKQAVAKGWWTGDPVDSTYNTSTRTFCRNPNTMEWYICVTKGSSFGKVNSSDAFTGN